MASQCHPVTVNAVSDWLGIPDTIHEAAKRLQGVQIEKSNAIRLIDKYNRENCLIYADPPYVLETRTQRHYANEMTMSQHEVLLQSLNNHIGYVMISGYDNELYNDLLKGWTKNTIMATTEAANKRQEVLWLNPKTAESGYTQTSLFEAL